MMELHGDTIEKFLGLDTRTGRYRISSQILNYDPETNSGRTLSGSSYQFMDRPGKLHFSAQSIYEQLFDAPEVNISLGKFAVDHGAIVHGLTKKYGMWLSHCPIHPQERYRTKANIHGHLHKSVITKMVEGVETPDPYYVNVCCEHVNYKPISLEDIRERVELTS